MSRAQQLPRVSTKYGAPMGRISTLPPGGISGRAKLFRVRLDSGGYDDGGAYWGIGGLLYCLDALEGRAFFRIPREFLPCNEYGQHSGTIRALAVAFAVHATGCEGIPRALARKPTEADYLQALRHTHHAWNYARGANGSYYRAITEILHGARP